MRAANGGIYVLLQSQRLVIAVAELFPLAVHHTPLMDSRFQSAKDAIRELQILQSSQPFDKAGMRAVQDWLCDHPEEAAAEISVCGLGKYDGRLAGVVGRIGAPVATSCIPALVGQMLDLNWPAYPKARDALFSFDADSLLAGLQIVIERGELEAFDCFCYEVLTGRPV